MTFIELSAVMGNIGEFVGSFAVLATLIYLAVQVRYSKDLLERNEKISLSQVYNNRNKVRADINMRIADSSFLLDALTNMPASVHANR